MGLYGSFLQLHPINPFPTSAPPRCWLCGTHGRWDLQRRSVAGRRLTPNDLQTPTEFARPKGLYIYIYSIPLHHLVGADGRRRLSGEGVRHGGREALLEEVHPRRIGVRLSDHLSFKNMMTSLESNQTYQVTR